MPITFKSKVVNVNARSNDAKSKKQIPIEVPVLSGNEDVQQLLNDGGTLKGFQLFELTNYSIDLKLRGQTRQAHAPKTGSKQYQSTLASQYLKAMDEEAQLMEVVLDDPINGLHTFYKENKAAIDAWAEDNESEVDTEDDDA